MRMQDPFTRLDCALTMNDNHSLKVWNWHSKRGWESTKSPAKCPAHLVSTSKILKTFSNQTYVVLKENSLPQRERSEVLSCQLPAFLKFARINAISIAQPCSRRTFKNKQWLGTGSAVADQWCTCSVALRSTGAKKKSHDQVSLKMAKVRVQSDSSSLLHSSPHEVTHKWGSI